MFWLQKYIHYVKIRYHIIALGDEFMIAIIDYGAGNIQSVNKALKYIGCEAFITRDKEQILQADGAVLPGVGSFGDTMNTMNSYGIKDTVIDFINSKKLQRGRVMFPLPVRTGNHVSYIQRSRWQMDHFFRDQEYYTLIFDNEKQMALPKDTTIDNVIVEKIHISQGMVE